MIFQLAALLAVVSLSKGDGVLFWGMQCRLRVTNISKETADIIRSDRFDPQFELADNPKQRTVQQRSDNFGGDSDSNSAEVIYAVFGSVDFVAVTYQSLDGALDKLKLLGPDQFAFRCSNTTVTNTSHGIVYSFIDSYTLTLGPPVSKGGLIRRSVSFHHQDRADCYDQEGHVDPYSLNTWPRYAADGERYDMACQAIKICSNGKFGGVSRCTPSPPPSPDWVTVRKVGECCESGLSKSKIEAKGCPKSVDEIVFKGIIPTGPHYQPPPIPWQIRFQNRAGMKCDGVIINKHWFLTRKSCLNDTRGIEFLRPYGMRYGPPGFKNFTIVDVRKVGAARVDLALAKFNLSEPSQFPNDWTTQMQEVNLPWNKTACENMLNTSCLVLIGTNDEQNQTALASIFVLGEANGQRPDPNSPYIRGIQRKSDMPELPGSGAVSWYDNACFLVGISDGNDHKSVTSLCVFLDDIRDKIKKAEEE